MKKKNETEIMKNWNGSDIPYVSIALVTYNHEKYVEEALDSILMQETDFPFEIVFHDDASTDDTPKILKEYMKKYPNIIRGILQKENQYSQGKRVDIIVFNEISSKYIAICEGDDYWIDQNKLQVQIDVMEKNPDCHLSFHAAEVRIQNDKHGKIIARHAKNNKVFTTSEVISGGGQFCPTASIILRRDSVILFLENEIFKKAPVGDYFIQIFSSLHGGALYINQVMSVYRQGIEGSWSSSMHDLNKQVEHYQRLIKVLDELDSYFNYKYHKELLLRKSKEHYLIATFFFHNNMFKEYKKYMELSYDTYRFRSFVYQIYYYFRSCPWLLKYAKKILIS